MNILVTGADGLLGKSLIKEMSKHHRVSALVKDSHLNSDDSINYIKADLSDFSADILPNSIDAVYYLAQSNGFRDFPDSAKDMFEVNIYSPLKMAEWASNSGVKKFIYASSGGVYTDSSKLINELSSIDASRGSGFYTDSKLSAEMLLKNYAQYFETFAIIRPFFMYGVGQNETMLIPRLIKNIKNGNEVLLSGSDGIKINPIYITDAAKSISEILNIDGEHIINIAGDETISLKELALLIGDIVDKKPVFKQSKNRQNDLVADITVMKNRLSSPLVDIRSGIKKMVEKL